MLLKNTYIETLLISIRESLEFIYALHDKARFRSSWSLERITLELVGDDVEVDDRFIDSILYVMPNLVF